MVGDTLVVIMMSILAATLFVLLPVVLFFWLILRKRSDRGMSGKEEDKLRHIWNGLQRMEHRIENLETILAGQRRGDPLDDAARRENVRAGRIDSDPHARW